MTPEKNVATPRLGSAFAPWTIAVVATLGTTVSHIDRQTLSAIAPSVTKALAIDNTRYGWLLSAFAMAYLVGAPFAGVVLDRFGARRGFALAVLIWSFIAGAHALAFSFLSLFLLRIALGLAEAPSFPAAAQAVRHALPGARRPLAFGMLFTGSTLGAVVAVKLSLALEAVYGYRGAFLGTALIGTLWIPIWLLATRKLGDVPRPETAPATTRATWIAMAKSPPVIRTFVVVVGSAPALMFALQWASKYLADVWHIAKVDAGSYLIAMPILFDLGAVGFGAIASQREKKLEGPPRTHKDLLLASTVLVTLLAFAPLTHSPIAAISLMALSACGGGGIYALATSDMFARVPVQLTSSAGGIAAAGQSLAHIVTGPLIGWSIDRTHGYHAAFVALGLVVVPTSLAFVLWPGMDRPGSAPPSCE